MGTKDAYRQRRQETGGVLPKSESNSKLRQDFQKNRDGNNEDHTTKAKPHEDEQLGSSTTDDDKRKRLVRKMILESKNETPVSSTDVARTYSSDSAENIEPDNFDDADLRGAFSGFKEGFKKRLFRKKSKNSENLPSEPHDAFYYHPRRPQRDSGGKKIFTGLTSNKDRSSLSRKEILSEGKASSEDLKRRKLTKKELKARREFKEQGMREHYLAVSEPETDWRSPDYPSDETPADPNDVSLIDEGQWWEDKDADVTKQQRNIDKRSTKSNEAA